MVCEVFVLRVGSGDFTGKFRYTACFVFVCSNQMKVCKSIVILIANATFLLSPPLLLEHR